MISRRLFVTAVPAVVVAPLSFWAGAARAAHKELVEYRLPKWKNAHFDDSDEADAFMATLKKLECEAATQDHNGHIDVRYRCVKWKQISLKTHEEAHQWEHWLKARGFETKHVH
jgi:hypothetical protein